MATEQYKVMEQNNELVFKNTNNDLLYNENEILEKINKVKSTNLDVFVEDAHKWTDRTNLTLSKDIIVNRNVDGLKIYSNNGLVYHIYTSFKANSIWAKWLFGIVKKIDNEQKEISDDVKIFFKKYSDAINYTDMQINEILNKEKFRHSTRSKEKILEIRNKYIESELNGLLTKLFNRLDDEDSWKKIDILIQKANDTYNSEILLKIIEAINCKRKEIGFEKFENILKLLFELLKIISVVTSPIFLKTILNIFTFKSLGTAVGIVSGLFLILFEMNNWIECDSTVLSTALENIVLLICECLIQTYQRILLKNSVKSIKKQLKKNASVSKKDLNNTNKEIVKENTAVKKEVYLELLKECINLMAENPNIDWTTEKKKIMILAEGYTKYKKTSQLDNITLLQTCPTFMSELCDLEIAIKNKIATSKKEDVYEEDLAEITTLLDNIKTPKMALKLERKL